MTELIDEISEAKCNKIVENISFGCEEGEIRYIIKQLAEPLGIELIG